MYGLEREGDMACLERKRWAAVPAVEADWYLRTAV
jgi:hypothetical protein